MKATGRHLLAEYSRCNTNLLNDLGYIEKLMRAAAQAAGATIVASVFHPFSPQGVSGVVVVEESHLSIHTWPEHNYAAVDFFTCGECVPGRAHEVLKQGLEAESSELMLIKRGLLSKPASMRMIEHSVETQRDGVVRATDLKGAADGLPVEEEAPATCPVQH